MDINDQTSLALKLFDVMNKETECEYKEKKNVWTYFRLIEKIRAMSHVTGEDLHKKKRFDCLWVTFPARGHSYLECDKNMGLINQKARFDCKKEMFYGWGEFLNGYYRKKCPFAQRSIAEYHVKEDSKLAFLRQSYSGP
ncbi:hypothetical protein ANN_01085 [Periplaneta americana]|uniref:Uncharacterized protein n=1 Tax=Periplaneta americana TaxID=6978 RepID=A0ABQ8TSL0_PERAM|nr:hypothetical protein ANN_01085 [Periplaneta americana]